MEHGAFQDLAQVKMSNRRQRIRPDEEAVHFIVEKKDKLCFYQKFISNFKGRGVFAHVDIAKGSFLLEYRGELISYKDRDTRRSWYSEQQNAFVFDFQWNNKTWCIDASHEDGTLGRLVNDDNRHPNSKIKKMMVEGRPHLCLFAIEDIKANSEITYDYGNCQWPWRAHSLNATTSAETDKNTKCPSALKESLNATNFAEVEPSQKCPSDLKESLNTTTSPKAEPRQECPPALKESINTTTSEEEPSQTCSSTFTESLNATTSAETEPSSKQSRNTTTSSEEEPSQTCSSTFTKRRVARLQNLKQHHNSCEDRYNIAETEIAERERQWTRTLLNKEQNKTMSHNTCEDPPHNDCEDSPNTDCEDSSNTDYEDGNYVPDSESSSDGSCHSMELGLEDHQQRLKKISKEIVTSCSIDTTIGSSNSTCYDGTSQCSSDSSSYHCTVTSSTDMPTTVTPIPRKGNKYSKKQYCLYCEKPVSKLARHLESVHKNEQDVALALRFDKGSKKRKDLLRVLKKRGNFTHNATVATSGVGELVACRRPGASQPSDAFVHCKFCQGLYSRKCLWRHVKRDHRDVQSGSEVGRKGLYLHLPKPDSVKDAVWKIACAMNNDDISAVVRSEDTILQFGESLYNSRKAHEKRNDNIRQKMREMARLLIEARAITPLKTMEDLVTPTNFLHIIKAVKSTTGYKEESNSYAIPSLALKLGHSLIKVAGIIHCNALIEDRKDVAESAKNFGILYKKKWSESISSAALGTLEQAKWNKPQVLPFTEDVTSLHKYLSVQSAKCMKTLEEEPSKKSFANLAKLTLTQVILFNRRREGEASKMELQSYTSRDLAKLNPDILVSLSEFERKLAEHFERVEIRGKRSRKVPVLLTPDMTAALDLLAKKREECEVPKENIYVFARPEAMSYYRGSDCFREYAKLCGAQHPEALTSTKLRKQVATLSTVLNLKDNEMDQLATFLGHDIRVHREYYRLPESTLQLAKVSKLLMAMEKGILPDFQGKQLDDIVINPEDELDSCDSAEEDDFNKQHIEDSSGVASQGNLTTPAEHNQINDSNFPEGTPQATRGHTMETTSKRNFPKKAVKMKRRRWTQDEVKAVERHMLDFITRGQVPGKRSCDACLHSEAQALKERDWVDIKNYIHNRITALKRKLSK